MHDTQYAHITASEVIARGPIEVVGVLVNASTSAASADLYDQADRVTTDLLFKAKASPTATNVVALPYPIKCERGLYVVVNSNVDGVGIQYQQLEKS